MAYCVNYNFPQGFYWPQPPQQQIILENKNQQIITPHHDMSGDGFYSSDYIIAQHTTCWPAHKPPPQWDEVGLSNLNDPEFDGLLCGSKLSCFTTSRSFSYFQSKGDNPHHLLTRTPYPRTAERGWFWKVCVRFSRKKFFNNYYVFPMAIAKMKATQINLLALKKGEERDELFKHLLLGLGLSFYSQDSLNVKFPQKYGFCGNEYSPGGEIINVMFLDPVPINSGNSRWVKVEKPSSYVSPTANSNFDDYDSCDWIQRLLELFAGNSLLEQLQQKERQLLQKELQHQIQQTEQQAKYEQKFQFFEVQLQKIQQTVQETERKEKENEKKIRAKDKEIEKLHQKLEEKEKEIVEEKKQLEQQEREIEEQERKIKEQERKMKEQERKMKEQEQRLQQQQQQLQQQQQQIEQLQQLNERIIKQQLQQPQQERARSLSVEERITWATFTPPHPPTEEQIIENELQKELEEEEGKGKEGKKQEE